MTFRISLLCLAHCLFASPESTLEKMSLDEKIGQLFMIPACPLRGEDHFHDWEHLIATLHIGGAIVKQSDPVSQVRFLNRLQRLSPIPLLIGADAEWGLGMRMSGVISFPKNGLLAAVDVSKIYEVGFEIGRQARLVGVHLNFAPVADVNSNPDNPIIGIRSFGADPKQVALRVSAYIRGLQDAGVFATVKHFPGHGDTTVDSHVGLPLIVHCRHRLDEVELFPFKEAIEAGVFAFMSGHLLVPALDPLYPASLSAPILQDLLRKELGFQGLIISDALNMKALTEHFSFEEIAVLARRAGTDLLLYGGHLAPDIDAIIHIQVPRAVAALKEAYTEGSLSMHALDESVLRILRAKEKIEIFSDESRLPELQQGEMLKEELYQFLR